MRRWGAAAMVVVLLLVGGVAWVLLEEDRVEIDVERPLSRAAATGAAPPRLPPAPATSAEAEDLARDAPATPAPRPVEEAVLRGQIVRQADGSPLVGARASWILDDGRPDSAVPTSVADAEGRFALAWPGGSADRLLLLRWQPFHSLLEAGPERDVPLARAAFERRITIAASAARGVEQQFELDTGWTIAGTALTPAKELLFGARFTVLKPFATGESDLRGRFYLRDLPHEVSKVTVMGSAPGRGSAILAVARPEGEAWRAEMAVFLPEPGTVVGSVLYPSGVPAAGARVEVLLREHEAKPPELRSATVDEVGRFRVSDLPTGSLDVVVWPDTRAAARAHERVAGAAWRRDVPIGDDRSARVDLFLPRGVDVSGRVVDGSGEPLRYHVVFATEEFDGWLPTGTPPIEAQATTDATGAFVLHDVLPGMKTFVVFGNSGYDRHPDMSRPEMPEPGGRSVTSYPPKVDEIVRLSPFELATRVDVGGEGPRDLELVVDALWSRPEPWTVSGRVVDDAGHPVVGALVDGVLPVTAVPPMAAALSSEGGRFSISLGEGRTRVVLELSAAGLLRRQVPVWNSVATPDLGDIVLHRAPRLVVSVVDDVSKDLVPSFSAVLQQFGGGRPATLRRFDDVREGVLEVDLDRLEGTWVLTVQADGWRRFRQHGEHVVGEEPLAYLIRMVRA